MNRVFAFIVCFLSCNVMSENSSLPNGLTYKDDFLTFEEEEKLIEYLNQSGVFLDSVPSNCGTNQKTSLQPNSQRKVMQFGYQFDYDKLSIDFQQQPNPMPEEILVLRKKIAQELGYGETFFNQCIVNRYLPAKDQKRADGISPHSDAACFYEPIVSVSLGSMRVMQFSREDTQQHWEIALQPRSLLALKGAARWAVRHGIFPDPYATGVRYSITFRHVFLNH
jgi:alkylated DNA repair dioxygenase AlkB